MTSGSTARKPQPIRPGNVKRISLVDLDLDQIEAAEVLVGLSVKHWDEAPSQGRLFKAVYAVAFGVPIEDAGKLTLRQLQEAVDLSGDDPDSSRADSSKRVALIARRIGWTVQEVRAHNVRDVEAMMDVVDDEDRARRRRAAHKKARGK